MSIKYFGVEQVKLSALSDNELSANEEDSATYNRLKDELETYGMLELPVVFRNGDGHLRIISGHHRVRGWKELGHKQVDAIILTGAMTKEEEFNLVNNLNQIHGDLTLSRVKRVIRQFNLDVTKLNLFKLPMGALMPKGGTSLMAEDMAKKARMRDMAIKLAGEIAELLIEQRDEDLVAFATEGKLIAVVHIQLQSAAIRRNVSVFKGIVEKTVSEWEEAVHS